MRRRNGLDARGAFCVRLSDVVELECGEQRTVVRNVRKRRARNVGDDGDGDGDGTGENRRIRIPKVNG